MAICPMKGTDCSDSNCFRTRCNYVLVPPIGKLHFVGFTDPDRYDRAVRHFGLPDFIHRTWDVRAQQEIAPSDVAIFAKHDEHKPPSVYSWDDSAQPDDPATHERN